MHGVARTIEQIRERGVPGFEVEVVGTDAGVDRRLPAATALEVPFYAGMTLGVPGLPDLAETLAEGRYDLVHVTAPGPAGVAASLLSRVSGTPLIASYHTELAAYAGLRSGDGGLEAVSRAALGAFYAAPSRVLSPSPAADRSLLALGADAAASAAGSAASTSRASPPRRPTATPSRADQGPLRGPADPREGRRPARRELPRAHRAEPRLHLLLAGGGPEEAELRARLGERATSSAGSRARISPGPTRAPTSSSSARAPTPTARSCSRPAPAACPSSPSPRAARRR